MAKLTVRFSDASKKDLKTIFDYGSIHWGEQKARSFLLELKEHVSDLTSQPLMGVERARLQAGLRCYPFNNYLIYYFIKEDSIDIVRVLHMKQDVMSHFSSNQNQ